MKCVVINLKKTTVITCLILSVIIYLSAFFVNTKDQFKEEKSISAFGSGDEIFYVNDEMDIVTSAKKQLPIYSVQRDDNKIAITFDNAWGADDIPQILKALDKYKAKATFFVLGIWVEKYPETVKMIYDHGHEIANHSYAHYKPTQIDKATLVQEIQKCNQVIKKVTGEDCKIYRPPYGDYNDLVIQTAFEEGMFPVQWDVDSIDWRPETTEQDILRRVTEKTKPGSILLFHNDTKHTANVMPEVLKQLTEMGYEFVTISELIYTDDYTIDHAGRQIKKK